MYAGCFIAGVQTPEGQLAYHIPNEWWPRYLCREIDFAPKWDGSGKQNVLERHLALRDLMCMQAARRNEEEVNQSMD